MGKELNFLGEENFKDEMATACKAWQAKHVQEGDLISFDGTLIHYYVARQEQPIGAIVMVHGFCEFWGKYHELAWYFYQAGYSVYLHEQRGHGYSGGKGKEADVVHVDSYQQYVGDLKAFLDQVVVPDTEGIKSVLFAHSMGGAVATLFLEAYPSYFDKAILSSPMLKMKAGEYAPALITLLKIGTKLTGKYRKIAPGQHHFDGVNVFETSSTMSKVRYDYMFELRLSDEHYQTYGASFGWALASMKATRALRAGFEKLRGRQIVVMTAGNDHLVDPAGYRQLLDTIPEITHYHYEASKHEIFNAEDAERFRFLKDLFAELEKGVSAKAEMEA